MGALQILREEEPPRPDVRLRQLGPAAEDCARKRRTSAAELEHQLSGDLALPDYNNHKLPSDL